MQTKEIRQKTIEEILELVKKSKEVLKGVNADRLQGKEKNVKKSSNTKREIARYLTVINEKKILVEAKHE